MQACGTTPFGQRPVTAGLMARIAAAQQPAPLPQINKYEIQRQITVARTALGVTDRDLVVLAALTSFHQGAEIADAPMVVVYPSNRALAERAHGMAESTLRRHLAALVNAGLILRQDSPNGKRFATRGLGEQRAFGFDLRPLLVRAVEIAELAAQTEASAAAERAQRQQASLILRDAAKLAEYGAQERPGAIWDDLLTQAADFRRQLRRKLAVDVLQGLSKGLERLLTRVKTLLTNTQDMSANDGQNERHHQNSKTKSYDLESCIEKETREKSSEPNLPLMIIQKACGEIHSYAQGEITTWADLIRTAQFVRGMMGISSDAWERAQRAMGQGNAAVVLAAMLERIGEINSPGGYLRALTAKAEAGAFSPGPMVMALLNKSTGTDAKIAKS